MEANQTPSEGRPQTVLEQLHAIGAPILSMDDPDFAEKFAAAIGIEPGEEVTFVTSQHEREEPRKDATVPQTLEEWEELAALPRQTLLDRGLGVWSTLNDDRKDRKLEPLPAEDDRELWLLPGEWFDAIPAGLRLFDLWFDPFDWAREERSDDIRYGCLAYGILRPIDKPAAE